MVKIITHQIFFIHLYALIQPVSNLTIKDSLCSIQKILLFNKLITLFTFILHDCKTLLLKLTILLRNEDRYLHTAFLDF